MSWGGGSSVIFEHRLGGCDKAKAKASNGLVQGDGSCLGMGSDLISRLDYIILLGDRLDRRGSLAELKGGFGIVSAGPE